LNGRFDFGLRARGDAGFVSIYMFERAEACELLLEHLGRLEGILWCRERSMGWQTENYARDLNVEYAPRFGGRDRLEMRFYGGVASCDFRERQEKNDSAV
jgi:hypothetical protein